MRRKRLLQRLVLLLMVLLVCFAGASEVLANGEVTETEYSTSLSEATGIVRVVVAVFGGIIGVLGIFVAYRGVGRHGRRINVSFRAQEAIHEADKPGSCNNTYWCGNSHWCPLLTSRKAYGAQNKGQGNYNRT